MLGFDGSYSGDSTGLVGCTIEDPTLWVVDAWERPADGNPDWRVDIAEVEQSIREACSRWRVREVSCDPYRWARTIQDLGAEGLPMVEFPQSPARMVPATAKFYDAVTSGGLSHNADPRLERHVRNAQVKVDRQGPRIVKDAKSSPRKIDLAVCAVMAHDRATAQAQASESPEPFFMFS